jgi:branched-chain amino acid transport system permease protein
MVVFAGLTLVGLYEMGVPAFLALILTLGVMFLLAVAVERVVWRSRWSRYRQAQC